VPHLTLVALYGDKSPALSSFIASRQDMVSSAFGCAFRPYDVRQVHATIVGLEHSEGSFQENANFRRLRGQRMAMDVSGFLEFLRVSRELPFEVQIGGFAEQDRPFLSRGELPFARSFSIQADRVVVMGWPCEKDFQGMPGDNSDTLLLDGIRRRAQEFGILHAYHRSERDLDNDFFFRIGLVDRSALTDAAVTDLERRMRRRLCRLGPLRVKVGLEDLQVAAYWDERLPLSSTHVWSLTDPDPGPIEGIGTRVAAGDRSEPGACDPSCRPS
jgi:hypothetical protein